MPEFPSSDSPYGLGYETRPGPYSRPGLFGFWLPYALLVKFPEDFNSG